MPRRILLKGNSKLLKPVITEIMAMYQLIENIESGGGYAEDTAYRNRRYHPHIRLHFLEDTTFNQVGNNPSTYQGKRRLTGLVSFRIMNETSETISKGELTRIGTAIKNSFGANGGYTWEKGKELYTYADWDKGYQLQILAKNSSQPRDIISKILAIQSHTPDWVFLSKSGSESEIERYPDLPQTKIILGEQVTLKKVRPLVQVRFRYADAKVHLLTEPVVLYDLTNKKIGALVV